MLNDAVSSLVKRGTLRAAVLGRVWDCCPTRLPSDRTNSSSTSHPFHFETSFLELFRALRPGRGRRGYQVRRGGRGRDQAAHDQGKGVIEKSHSTDVESTNRICDS